MTPKSFLSPFIVQGDIGFFSYKNKNYGKFFCGVQTFSKKIFAVPIRNLKTPTLIKAIEAMTKVLRPISHKTLKNAEFFSFQDKWFKLTRTLLFDGESGLASKEAQNKIANKYNIKVRAEPHYKRNMAERCIRELKLRTALLLELEGKLHIFPSKKKYKNVNL